MNQQDQSKDKEKASEYQKLIKYLKRKLKQQDLDIKGKTNDEEIKGIPIVKNT